MEHLGWTLPRLNHLGLLVRAPLRSPERDFYLFDFNLLTIFSAFFNIEPRCLLSVICLEYL